MGCECMIVCVAVFFAVSIGDCLSSTALKNFWIDDENGGDESGCAFGIGWIAATFVSLNDDRSPCAFYHVSFVSLSRATPNKCQQIFCQSETTHLLDGDRDSDSDRSDRDFDLELLVIVHEIFTGFVGDGDGVAQPSPRVTTDSSPHSSSIMLSC